MIGEIRDQETAQIADLHHTMAKDFTGKMILQKKLIWPV